MRKLNFFILATCIFGISGRSLAQSAEPNLSPKDLAFFESKVRPLLVAKCYQCHSSKENSSEGGLLVDSREALLQGGDSGPAVVAGDPRASLLMKVIQYEQPDLEMPPRDAGGKMSAAEIEILARWIQMGLPDPRKRTTAGHEYQDYQEAQKWWSFQPMKQPAIPVADVPAASSDIDRFVHQARSEKGLLAGPDASWETLARRVYFDLTGLPPTVEELASFEKDVDSIGLAKTLEATVDRLLASPQFGAHWGRHWLDVARYAESSGRELNVSYPHAWRYRDWVVNAINEDKPYDQFLREQIAGDLLPSKSDAEKTENLIATGFLAVGSRALNEMNPKQFAVDQADEQIDTVFQASMALTVGCARCHDHKFDPIPQTDYTAVAGIFLSTDTYFGGSNGQQDRNTSEHLKLPRGSDQTVLIQSKTPDEVQQLKSSLAKVQSEYEELRRSVFENMRDAKSGSSTSSGLDRDYLRQRIQLERQRSELTTILEQYTDQGEPIPLAMGVSEKQPESKAAKNLRKLVSKNSTRQRSSFLSIADSPLFARGDIELPGERVPRGIPPSFGDTLNYEVPENTSGRLELARWITRDNNSLTARVAVNRIWSQLMGQGIVTSLDNFGTTGAIPTHPELLDHLALQFVAQGWSTKKMIREIVLSRTYRMGSNFDESSFTIDPENAFLWRMNPKRLTGESIRDGILVASGTLDSQPVLGSPLAEMGGGRVDRGLPLAGRRFNTETPSEPNSRSIYLSLPRGALPELLELFDAPDANAVQSRRDSTNVPAQSLYMLNSPWVASQSRLIARRITEAIPGSMAQTADERIDFAYRLILSRSPNSQERSIAMKLFGQLGANPDVILSSFARGLIASGEYRSID